MGWTIQGSNPGGAMDFSLLQNVHTGSGAQPAICLIGANEAFRDECIQLFIYSV